MNIVQHMLFVKTELEIIQNRSRMMNFLIIYRLISCLIACAITPSVSQFAWRLEIEVLCKHRMSFHLQKLPF